MFLIFMAVVIVSVFVLAFLIDISINLRRVNCGIAKLVDACEKSCKSPKA